MNDIQTRLLIQLAVFISNGIFIFFKEFKVESKVVGRTVNVLLCINGIAFNK
jgi:hypothetical protein